MDNIKKSIEKIQIQPELKEEIFNNILKKAEMQNDVPKVKKINFNRFVPYVAGFFFVICFGAIASSDIFNVPTNETAKMSLEPKIINYKASPFTVYIPNGNKLEAYAIENCENDPVLIWEEMVRLSFVPSEIKLLSFTSENNIVTLNFNKEFEKYTKENGEQIILAIKKTLQPIFSNQEIVIEYN